MPLTNVDFEVIHLELSDTCIDHLCIYVLMYTGFIFHACPRDMITSFEAFNQFSSTQTATIQRKEASSKYQEFRSFIDICEETGFEVRTSSDV